MPRSPQKYSNLNGAQAGSWHQWDVSGWEHDVIFLGHRFLK